MGAGERLALPAHDMVAIEGGLERSPADIATEAYRAVGREGNLVCLTYRRRIGVYPPLAAKVVHIGLPVLWRAQETGRAAAQVGILGDALVRASKRVSVYGNFRAVLVAMDSKGAVRGGGIPRAITPSEMRDALKTTDILVCNIDKPRTVKFFLPFLQRLTEGGAANVMVASVAPASGEIGQAWPAPGFVIAVGPAFPAKSLLTSATTRRSGLVANVDMAPTVAGLAGADFSGGTGHRVVSVSSDDAAFVLKNLDETARHHAVRLAWVLSGAAIAAFIVVLIALLAPESAARVVGHGVVIVAGLPLALLLVGLLNPLDPLIFLGVAIVGSGIFAAGATVAARWFGSSPVGLVFLLTVFVLILDTSCGGFLTVHSLLYSDYANSTRFFGMDTPLSALFIGMTLAGTHLLRPVLPQIKIVTHLLFAGAMAALIVAGGADNTGIFIVAAVVFVSYLFTREGRSLQAVARWRRSVCRYHNRRCCGMAFVVCP